MNANKEVSDMTQDLGQFDKAFVSIVLPEEGIWLEAPDQTYLIYEWRLGEQPKKRVVESNRDNQ